MPTVVDISFAVIGLKQLAQVPLNTAFILKDAADYHLTALLDRDLLTSLHTTDFLKSMLPLSISENSEIEHLDNEAM